MSFRSPQLHGYEDHIAIAEVIASTFPFAIDGLGLLNPMGMVYLPTWLGEFLYGKCRSIYRSSHGMVNDGWDDLVKLLRGYLFIDMLYSKPLMNQMNVRNYWSFYSWTKWSILCKKNDKTYSMEMSLYFTYSHPTVAGLAYQNAHVFVAGNQCLIYFGSKGCPWHCQFHSFLLVRKNPRVRSGECISMTQVSRFKYPYHPCMVYLPAFGCF